MGWGLAFILAINLYGLISMGYDKRQAKKDGWRVPESRLFLTALFGGAIGILIGMKMFRHKTKHWSFRIWIPFLAILNIGIIAWLAWIYMQ